MSYQIIALPIFKDNYVWTIINTHRQCAIIVDPGDALAVMQFLDEHQLQLAAILITHHHWDHTNGVLEIIKHNEVAVFGSEQSPFPYLSQRVKEGDQVKINYFPIFEVLAVPGHTNDHIAYYTSQWLFCGDTLFAAGCGRIFEGNALQLYGSLQKLAALSPNTAVYCAHEYTLANLKFASRVEPNNVAIKERKEFVSALWNQKKSSLPSSIKEEMKTNPFLRCHQEEIIHQVSSYCGKSLFTNEDVFQELRKWKDKF